MCSEAGSRCAILCLQGTGKRHNPWQGGAEDKGGAACISVQFLIRNSPSSTRGRVNRASVEPSQALAVGEDANLGRRSLQPRGRCGPDHAPRWRVTAVLGGRGQAREARRSGDARRKRQRSPPWARKEQRGPCQGLRRSKDPTSSRFWVQASMRAGQQTSVVRGHQVSGLGGGGHRSLTH